MDYVIYWDTLEISTISSRGPRAIVDVANWGTGWHVQYVNADGRMWAQLVSNEDAIRLELELVEAPLTVKDVM